MKKIFGLLFIALLTMSIVGCHKKGESPAEFKMDTELIKDTTTIEFVDSTHFNFDTINQGDKVQHTFRLKNTGQKNLIIARAFGSCGCTVPEYPKDPVKPGEIATIHVTFNSAGKQDAQAKTVTVVCNTEKRNEMLFLTGFVKTKK